ncbi:hypothetical protein VNI00_017607 [Paramarasmius palmivorus]|uniref:Uncharacterized protein n=1 Tax=Paramarasmius palmivorus TaxID=297713 RepID=A0AAW0B3V8_9AGAR
MQQPRDVLFDALDVVIKNIDTIKSLRRAVPDSELSRMNQELRQENRRLTVLVETMQKAMANMSTATPPTSMPIDAEIYTAPRRHPDFVQAYTDIFKPTDWQTRLDEHAKLVLSLQSEFTGFLVTQIEAEVDEEDRVIEYVAECRFTVGRLSRLEFPFALKFFMDIVEQNKAPVPTVQYNPRSMDQYTGEQLEQLDKFTRVFCFRRDQFPHFYEWIRSVLLTVNGEDPDSEPDEHQEERA